MNFFMPQRMQRPMPRPQFGGMGFPQRPMAPVQLSGLAGQMGGIQAMPGAMQAMTQAAPAGVQSFNPGPSPAGVQMGGEMAPMPMGGPQRSAMPSYKWGTDYVPQTGPAMIHQGEMIIPAPKAKKLRPLSSLMRMK